MNGLNALKMRQEPKRGAKLAEKLKCEKSSIHYLSILNGNTRGLVWTDDPTAPQLAVVYSYLLGGFQIMGTPLQTAEEYAAFRLFFANGNTLFSKNRRKAAYSSAVCSGVPIIWNPPKR